MYPRSFLCEEAKIKRRTPLRKELCEIGEEAIWESRFTSFFLQCRLYTMTPEKPLNLRCFAAGSTTAVIRAVKKKCLLIMNTSREIRIRFKKY